MFTGMRHYATLEMNFNSVERIVEFTEIEQETTATNGVQLPALVRFVGLPDIPMQSLTATFVSGHLRATFK